MFMKPKTSQGLASEHESQNLSDGTNLFGWWSRLSADGYLDCTEWLGPFDTEVEAIKALWGEHGDDCQTVEDVCQYTSQFADFWKGYTQSLGFTSQQDNEDGDSLFDGPGDFDQNHPDCLEGWWDKLTEDEQQSLIGDAAGFFFDNLADIADKYEQAGSDFHLTRNRHGAGFWDGYWPGDIGKRLTDAAHVWGTCELVGTLDENGDIATASIHN